MRLFVVAVAGSLVSGRDGNAGGMKVRRIMSGLFAVMLSGCGSAAQNSDVGFVHTGLSTPVIAIGTNAVEIVESGPAASSADQEVTGYSCRNKVWDPSPSRDNAISLMKNQASERGFTAIHSIKVFDDPFSVAKNCWSGIQATGIAFNPKK